MKVLIMGLRSAGKTSLVKHVFEGKEWEDVKDLKPTEFVNTVEYKYRGLLEVTIFDAGGQKQFIYQYFTEQWASRIFSKVGIFIWVLDSSDKKTFREAERELKKAIENLNKYSPECRKFIVASKYDKHAYSLKQLRQYFAKWDIEEISATSIPLGIAREIVCTILDGAMSPQEKLKVNKLQKFLAAFNKKESASATMIINKADGLEIAGSINVKHLLKPKLKLKYLSIKSFIEPLEIAKKIFAAKEEQADFALYKIGNNYTILYDLTDEFALFSIIPERNFKIGNMLRRLQTIREKILQFLD
ncbi:MAG: ADP-ribosylation factor-like protein [Candidatus Helarchaeota archaeon]